jgi:hypothetical protein
MRHNPIPDLVRLGYTWREAAFLYLTGVNSGFFLYRQYCDFMNRKLGALAQRLVEKGTAYGHIEVLDYGQRRHVYHLKSRTLYRLFGNEESQSRRPKGDHEIKTRLMVLDYVLTNREEPCLTLEQEKINFFSTRSKVPREALPATSFAVHGRGEAPVVRYFPDRFPIYFRETASEHTEVRFVYFDNGASTVRPFIRFLERHRALMEQLGAFELVYVADSGVNQLAAERAFYRTFPKTSKLLPFGLEHLTRFLEAQALWDSNDPKFSQEDLEVLKEGERVYTLPEHSELQLAWAKGKRAFEAQLARLGEKQVVQGKFHTHILEGVYPIFGHRYRGKAPAAAAKSQFGASSNSNSIAS